MTILPIFERELRVASRQWRTYYSRSFAGGISLLFVCYLLWIVGKVNSSPSIGALILTMVSYVALMFCAFAGIGRTADCLSSEKREDTLGLLFLTHLRGQDIVLGKLLANSLRAIYFLLGAIPVLSLPVLIGGVGSAQMVRVPLVLLNTLLLSLSVGIFISAISKSQRAAAGASSFLMILLLSLPVLARYLAEEWEMVGLAISLNLLSPTSAMEMGLGSGLGLTAHPFWKGLALQFSLSGLLLIGAALLLPHTWQRKASGLTWKQWLEALSFGSPQTRKERREYFLDRNPFFWLGARDRFSPWWPALFAVGVLTGMFLLVIAYEIPTDPALGMGIAGIAGIDLYFRNRVASLASQQLARDRQIAALEMILSTPLTVHAIIRGQWMAIRRGTLATYVPFLFVATLYLGFLTYYWEGGVEALTIVGYALLLSVGDYVTLGYVAMWQGMRVQQPPNAAGISILRVVALPWVIFACLLPFLHEMGAGAVMEEYAPYSFVTLSLSIWMTSSALALVRARRNLLLHFREAATDRYSLEQKHGWKAAFQRWFAAYNPFTFLLLRRERDNVIS